MKNVKLFFSALAVFTVVGSALAFTPHKEGTFRCRTEAGAGTCPTVSIRYIEVASGGNLLFCNNGNETNTNCNTERRVQNDE